MSLYILKQKKYAYISNSTNLEISLQVTENKELPLTTYNSIDSFGCNYLKYLLILSKSL